MNVVFFGASKFVLPLLDVLNKNYNLCLIVTTESLDTEPVHDFAKTHSLPLLALKGFDKKAIEQINKHQAPIAVLAYFGIILPKTVLSLFPKGILNIHPSLLPKYRGPTPVQTALLNGDTTTGVTLIKLDEQTDHGPILVQEKEAIEPNDTAESLYERLFKIGSQLLQKTLPLYLKDEILKRVQDDNKATHTENLTRQSGYFDIQNPPVKEQLDRMIRAYYPWPGAWTEFRIKNSELRIKLLPGGKIQMEGKKPVSFKDFLNGYPSLPSVMLNLIQHLIDPETSSG